MAEGNENHQYEYDFCIFYQEDERQDSSVAINILDYLEQNGDRQLKGYIEDRDAILGRTHINNMDNIITNSRFVIVILSEEALQRNWFKFKLHASLKHRLDSDLRNTVIPIYTGHVHTVPPSLALINGVDYDADRQSRFWRKLQQLFFHSTE
ncbi:hypothetical protein ACJMK2_043733 [Sinanodonta woodiana]|uniref:TIR domain-containing protein n=1 Tax=Sinanodonta woodiana TaxID=1069815 RepID=A0ABD3W101_SINWO